MSTTGSLRGRDLLSVADLSRSEVEGLFDRTAELKAEFRASRRHARPALAGRTVAMLFQKPSLRTRVTFEAGAAQLGGHAIYLTNDVVLGARESVRDVARNLERLVDAIVVRTGPHEVAVELAAQAAIPVINGLTLREHPCQALADLFTIREQLGRLDGVVLLLAIAGPDAIVMHCLPAHHGEEITSEVMDGPHSVIFDQSENRLHVQKTLLVELIGAPDPAGQPAGGQQ